MNSLLLKPFSADAVRKAIFSMLSISMDQAETIPEFYAMLCDIANSSFLKHW